ncbi:hypothetical protein L3X38_018801 [Prunus dulcis]|uniref:Retrotransposon gag domain-containing protein n=1 Tax=Prunus dulcis TaxID=3755 RepID=A0AAD4WBF8_PRUDU|nr:hypothetical protein L3X38_018801 [Prunus dulcis]
MQLQTFCQGLNPTSKAMIDAASGGALMEKTVSAASALFDSMAANYHQWGTDRGQPKRAGVPEIEAFTTMAAQISNLNKKFANLMSINSVQCTNAVCGVSADLHSTANCPVSESFPAYMQEQNQQASIQKLEVQLGQMANALNAREKGVIPSQTKVNPKNQEQIKVITLSNGREVESAPKKNIPENAENSKIAIEFVESSETTPTTTPKALSRTSKSLCTTNSVPTTY